MSIRVTIGDVQAATTQDDITGLTFYWCAGVSTRAGEHGETEVAMGGVSTIQGALLPTPTDITIATSGPIYIEPSDFLCHGELSPGGFCPECGMHAAEDEGSAS